MITPTTQTRSLNALMEEAGRHAVPSLQEERALIKAAKRGNKAAIERLVLGNLRFVIKMAHSLGRNSSLIEELTAAGIAGMMEALKAYCQQASRGGRFIHYAVFHIRRQMRTTLNDFRSPVTANPNNYDIAQKIFAFEDAAQRTQGRRVSTTEVGKHFGLTPNRVERMKRLMERPMYLDHTLGGDDTERSGHDVCADKNAALPSALTESRMELELLKSVMHQHLTEREIIVLERRFGMGTGSGQDLRTIGHNCDISRERVRQIEMEALKKLRFHLSQVCPLYRERADRGMGIVEESQRNISVLPSRLKAPAISDETPVAAAPAHKSAAKIHLVREMKRELVECAA